MRLKGQPVMQLMQQHHLEQARVDEPERQPMMQRMQTHGRRLQWQWHLLSHTYAQPGLNDTLPNRTFCK